MPSGSYQLHETKFSWKPSYFLQKLNIFPRKKKSVKQRKISRDSYKQTDRLSIYSENDSGVYDETSFPRSIDDTEIDYRISQNDNMETMNFNHSNDYFHNGSSSSDWEEEEDMEEMKRKLKSMPSTGKIFGKKKSKSKLTHGSLQKTFSMESGLAAVALTASNGVGITGVEDVVHQAMCQCEGSSENLMMKYVADNIIGKDLVHRGPFGPRKVVYCDYTASGKSVRFIEDYIRDEVLPYYGNTHTTTSVSSLQTTNLRNEAKQIIRKCLNCTDQDAVIFVSSGTTGAIGKLIHALELKTSPVVFISPYEHHSNLLPWLEIGAEIVYGVEANDGTVDLEKLEENLKQYSTQERPMIGSFSAASNITGILSPVDDIAILLHRYGAYAFFDYATAGPYVEIDMNPHLKNPEKHELAYKDAFFCSIHKFVGGPGTPGLLVAKKHVFINPVPSGVGGGTVVFVTHKKHQYVSDVEEREEGGTPAIVESIRAGLVFQLKEEVSPENIMKFEHKYVHMAMKRWESIPNLYILGEAETERLPIFPILIMHPKCPKLLHHNFVSAILNDLFGVQARGGCACAGPYAEDLLSIDSDKAMKIADSLNGNFTDWEGIPEEEIKETKGKSFNILKPGFCRLNLPYFFDEDTIKYILDAVAFVAEHGWKLLPMYEQILASGEYKHKEPLEIEQRSQLSDVRGLMMNGMNKSFSPGGAPLSPMNGSLITSPNGGMNKKLLSSPKSSPSKKIKSAPSFKDILKEANDIVLKYEKKAEREKFMDSGEFLPPTLSKLMTWFLLPHEAHSILKGKIPHSCKSYEPVFFPREKPSLSNQNGGLSRTRLKSGIGSERNFCTCPAQRLRHIKNDSCIAGYEYKWSRTSRKMRFRPRKISTVNPPSQIAENQLDINGNDKLQRLKRRLSVQPYQEDVNEMIQNENLAPSKLTNEANGA